MRREAMPGETAVAAVDRIMRSGVTRGVFPGAVLLVAAGERTLCHRAYGAVDSAGGRPVRPETVFDLASLTKPLATTLAVMLLADRGKIDLDRPVGSVLSGYGHLEAAGVTVRHLLAHTSGLPDYRPFYRRLAGMAPERARERLNDLLRREAPLCQPGEKTLYSDLGFMVLARVVEALTGEGLDRTAADGVYRPLGVTDLFFVRRGRIPAGREFAATERCPWRGRVMRGEVHDENAWAVGGVDGHAGLFGTAAGIARLMAALQAAWNGEAAGPLPGKLVRTFLAREKGRERALGFDAPVAAGSSSGRHFSLHSVGHLGFTGTSFWMDLDREIHVVLLTNRVHPTRGNTAIRGFRPRLHDAVMESCAKWGATKQRD